MKDCVIICGYPTNKDGQLSLVLKSRIQYGVELYQSHQIKYLIVSGGAVHNPYCEAEAMLNYAISQGVPEEAILIENKAISTYHNMKYSKEIMDKHHLKNCFIVTNGWHMVKAKHYAKKFGLDFTVAPCPNPKQMSFLSVGFLYLYTYLRMVMQRFKGFS